MSTQFGNSVNQRITLSTQGTPKKAKSEEFDSLFEDDLPF